MTNLRTSPIAAAALAVGLALFASSKAAFAAWPTQPWVNVPICTAAGSQDQLAACSDGSGGIFVTWADPRGGVFDIYAQHIQSDGSRAVGWAADGNPVCTAAGAQVNPVIATDAFGGAIIAWSDSRAGASDIWAQRVNGAGAVQWAVNGVQITNAAGNQLIPSISTDGVGGAFIVWEDYRNGGANIDIYGQRVNGAGALSWAGGLAGLGIFTAAGNQTGPKAPVVGSATSLIVCCDTGVRRLTSSGGNYPGWPAGGVPNPTFPWLPIRDYQDGLHLVGGTFGVNDTRLLGTNGSTYWTSVGFGGCAGSYLQFQDAVSDDNGGVIMFFSGSIIGGPCNLFGIYGVRLDGGGAVVPGWNDPFSWGRQIIANGTLSGPVRAVADGSGGAIIVYGDQVQTPSIDMYAMRISANGTLAPGWNRTGIPLTDKGTQICTAPNNQSFPVIVSDGAHGAIMAWLDERTTAGLSDIYCQKIERFGQLGNPSPFIFAVTDVRPDQGGKVLVRWTPSYLDVEPTFDIRSYWVWRQVPASAATSALKQGALLLGPDRAAEASELRPGRRLFRESSNGTQAFWWELADSIPAHGNGAYSVVANTETDSIGGSNRYTMFMVEAQHASDVAYWSSAVDSGYSVDNLPPAAPAPFSATYSSGTGSLHWGVSHETDFLEYRLYRGALPGFTPGPGNLVVSKPDTGYSDPAGAPYFYKLSAVDIHGNESPYALATPSGTTGVEPGGAAFRLALGPPRPNPMMGSTMMRISLPAQGRVAMTVFDSNGRAIRQLVDRELSAGETTVEWNGVDNRGRRVSAGIYFVRLRTPWGARSQRLVAMP